MLFRSINRSTDLTPSIQVLLVKMIRLGLMVLAVAIALGAVGINLSALAVFTGAAGVGIGLGLQKIVANFISGLILLVDKSVKPGDLVKLWPCDGGANQVWKAEQKDGFTKLAGVNGGCLDIRYGSKESGAPVQSWTCGDAEPNQLWRLQRK